MTDTERGEELLDMFRQLSLERQKLALRRVSEILEDQQEYDAETPEERRELDELYGVCRGEVPAPGAICSKCKLADDLDGSCTKYWIPGQHPNGEHYFHGHWLGEYE